MEDLDLLHNDNIVCPYCGHINCDSWEENDFLSNGSLVKTSCPGCGENFLCQMDIEITYTTKKLNG